ncbi:GNAT family N-acetyltransferase [Kitasatospora nipponensis]|uniref:GNAT family N-acetyltransferase n=1 Tax=Kitasatospora nipponensis TaxID=258049 RepID=A0ABN1WB95_9ACTN
MNRSTPHLRPTVEGDLDRILPLLTGAPACAGLTAASYRAKLADAQYRPEWTWAAEDDAGTLLAVAVWWGGSHEARPGALDGFFTAASVGEGPERTELAAALLRAAHAAFAATGGAGRSGDATTPPEYHVFLPGDWREQPAVAADLGWRRQAAALAGLSASLERLRFEWSPADAPPVADARLTFEPEADDEAFVELARRALTGSLDSHSSTEAARVGAERQAREDIAFYRDSMLGERSWWRVARDAQGAVVGFGLPSRNHAAAVVGYLAVLPEYRGHGYAVGILGEITRILATEAGATLVRADTDLVNRPMAEAFARAGYRNESRRLVLSAG